MEEDPDDEISDEIDPVLMAMALDYSVEMGETPEIAAEAIRQKNTGEIQEAMRGWAKEINPL